MPGNSHLVSRRETLQNHKDKSNQNSNVPDDLMAINRVTFIADNLNTLLQSTSPFAFQQPDIDEQMANFAKEQIDQVKIFLKILFGSCVRFYSTVLDWDYIDRMREDLIERLTSKMFDDEDFSNTILSLCREISREKEQNYS